jgi:hypothetical protein
MERISLPSLASRASAGICLAIVALSLMCTGVLLGVEDTFRLALAMSLVAACSLALLHNFRQAQAASRRKRRLNS